MNFIVILLSILSLVSSDDLPSARLLFYKSTNTAPVVEGKPFLINYQIFNNGESAASKIEISDLYDPNSFEILAETSADGHIKMRIDEVPPGGQTSLNVTVIPKLYGMYESTQAKIKYYGEPPLDGEEPSEESLKSGLSTSLADWGIFAAFISFTGLLPLFLWLRVKESNEKLTKRKIA